MGNRFRTSDGWVSVYRFADGALGTDSLGSNHLTNSGVTYNSGADFELSESDYMYRGDADLSAGFPCKDGTDNKDLAIWVKFKLESLPPNDSYNYCIISKVDTTTGRVKCSFDLYYQQVAGQYSLAFAVGYDSGDSMEYKTFSVGALSVGVLYGLGLSFDNSDKSGHIKLIDNAGLAVYESTFTTTNEISPDGAPFRIGCIDAADSNLYFFDGIIHFLAISNTPQTEATFDAIYADKYNAQCADWNIYVDWNNDDDYADSGEDISSYVLSQSWRYGKDRDSTLTGSATSLSFDIECLNTDGRFNSFLTTGPLYGNLLPGRKVKITSTYNSVTVTQCAGFISSIQPSFSRDGLDTATISGIGPLGFIQDKYVSVPIMQNAYTGEIVGAILDAIGWPAGDREIDTGDTQIPVFFIEDKRQVLGILEELAVAEGGGVYETKDGKIGWESRSRRASGDYLVSQATFTNNPASALGYSEIEQSDSLEMIYNKATATVKTRATYPLDVIWTSAETGTYSPSIAAAATKTYWTSIYDPIVAVLTWTTPAATTDFLANTQADGAGTNKTANVSVVATKFATSMKIELTNNDAGAVYITFLQARGIAVVELDDALVKAESATSQTKYGLREFPLDNKWLRSTAIGQLCVDSIVATFKDPHPNISISYPATRSIDQLTEALTRKFGDRITLQDTDLGISEDFFVDEITVGVSVGGTEQQVRYNLAPVTGYGPTWVADSDITVTPPAVSNISGQGWTQTCAFTVTDNNTVSWGAGTFKTAEGVSYSISAGNTGNMAARNYIYFDVAVSTTAYQITTTATNAAGVGRVQIGTAINGTVEAAFQIFGGAGESNIPGTSIVTASVTGSEIASNTITAANIYAGTITATEIASNTITAGLIAANTITASQLAATAIDAMTITGATIRTASGTGARVVMTTAGIIGYNSSNVAISKWDATDGTANFNQIYSHDYSCDIDLSVDDQVIIDTHQGVGGALKITGDATHLNLYALPGDRGSDPVDLHIHAHQSGEIVLGLDGGATPPTLTFSIISSHPWAVFSCNVQAAAFYQNSIQVVGAQGAAVADAVAITAPSCPSGSDGINIATFNNNLGTLYTEVNAIKTVLNTLLARQRAHGLIAT